VTPAARLAAAADVLDRIATSRLPAEAALKTWGQGNRYAGSKDRRAIADRVYRCLRARARLAWAMGREDGRALVIASLALLDGLEPGEIDALFSGEGYAPSPLTEEERARLAREPGAPPAWVSAGLPAFVADDFRRTYGVSWAEEAEALMLPRAPIDLRVNGAKASVEAVEAELRAEGLEPQRTPWSAWGLRLQAEPPPNVQKLAAWREGRIEVQDEGSQLAAWLADARPGMTVVDYCAGGGGKTLALAQQLSGVPSTSAHPRESGDPGVFPASRGAEQPNKKSLGSRFRGNERNLGGSLIACDVVQKRLDAIRPRLARAGLVAELRLLTEDGGGLEDLAGSADLVFVDAPCSGSGTWRRRPEDAWRLTEDEVERLHALQVGVLTRAADLCRPGARLVYVTCSVLSRENEDSVAAFEAARPDFRPVAVADALATPDLTDAARERLAALADGHRLRLSPRATSTDGFFAALYERTP
jgi:16S rRNA (cytosine967-C5)-methyltransferase